MTKLLAFGLAKNMAAPTSSDDSPNRPIGVWARIDCALGVGDPSGFISSARFCSAGKNPGVIEFTRTPLVAHSRDKNCVRFNTAALAAE